MKNSLKKKITKKGERGMGKKEQEEQPKNKRWL